MPFPHSKTRMVLRILLLLPLLGLLAAACSHVPLATMVKLRDFDLLKTDPDGIRVAVRYPDSINIPEGAAGMHLTVRTKSDAVLVLEEKVAFEELISNAEKAELGAELKDGTRIGIYRIPPENIAFFRSFQEFMLSKSKAERETMEGNMSVSVSGCRVSRQMPGKIPVSTYLKTSELGSYVPLMREVDLVEVMADAPDVDTPGLLPCDKPELPEMN